VSEQLAGFIGSKVTGPSPESIKLERLSAELLELERDGFHRLDAAELERRGRYLVDPHGQLWRHQEGVPPERHRLEWAYAVVDHNVVWYRRSESPATVAELDRIADEQRQTVLQQQAEETARREARRRNPSERAVTMGDLTPNLGRATLRELAERLEAAGGVLYFEKDGGLTIRAERVGPNVAAIARALYAAEVAIRVCAKRTAGPVSPDDLPDQELLPNGSLLPAGLTGR
jgi:hypothetical protein